MLGLLFSDVSVNPSGYWSDFGYVQNPPDLGPLVDLLGDPGDGDGCTGSLATGCFVNAAIKKAQELLKKPDCANFIGGTSPVDPSTMLGYLAEGSNVYGNISVGPIDSEALVGPGSNVNATTELIGPSVPSSNGAALITINSNPSSFFNNGVGMNGGGFSPGPGPFDQTTLNAETILHELGHALNYIFGNGTSGIFTDGPAVPGGTLLSVVNRSHVILHCLH